MREEDVIAGRYRLRARLGEGGQGSVWDADDLLGGARVAVKVFHPSAGLMDARVRREVATLRLLQLPGVVRLLDEGVHERQVFLVTERIYGAPFPGDSGGRAWSDIQAIALRLLEALVRVHAAGVVHRDLKPANVLVDAEGRPTLLDFGLSYSDGPGSDRLTGAGQWLGTPAYLAPEQAGDGRITPRADLFALGVMLYEALAGRMPHQGKGVRTLLRARMSDRPTPLREVAPGVPRRVADLIEQMLEVDPARRPRSALEALRVLRGERPEGASVLPMLGGNAVLAKLRARVDQGGLIELCGARGSGRTRMVRLLADALKSAGREVVWTAPSRAPFGSLDRLVGGLDEQADATLAEVRESVVKRAAEALERGVILIVDDPERLDASSRAVVDGLRGSGTIVMTALRATCAIDAPNHVHLAPIDEVPLRDLFFGPDRILHLREDAARLLRQRTAGIPGRVVHEIAAWVDMGLAQWNDEYVLVHREAFAHIEASLTPSASPASSREHGPNPFLDHLLAWAAIAWPNTEPSVLASMVGEPTWQVEAGIADIVGRGLGLVLEGGRLFPFEGSDESWYAERRQAAHRALSAVLPPGTRGRLVHVVAGGASTERAYAIDVATEADVVAERAARDGDLGGAIAALAEGTAALRRLEDPPLREVFALFTRWADIALAERRASSIDRFLYELCRFPMLAEDLSPLRQLALAAIALGGWSDQAHVAVQSIAPFEDDRLERARLGLRVLAARRASAAREAEVLAELEAWADARRDASSRSALAGWLGQLRYRQRRFEDAAKLQLEAASTEVALTLKISALLHAASALMEAFRLDEAFDCALRAKDLASTCRHAYLEARAEWLQRSIRYRLGQTGPCDLELVSAVAELHAPELEALICVNESAVAWRASERDVAHTLAARAWRIWSASGESLGSLLAGALVVASGGSRLDIDAATLAARALECSSPGVGLQVTALLALGGIDVKTSDATLEHLASPVPREHWATRMDVLSIEESLAIVSNAPPAAACTSSSLAVAGAT